MTPRATYRLQFHKGFTFADAEALVPYLARLGVSHIYASPIAAARAGSMHGYDVIDPTRINPELGDEQGFRRLAQAARRAGLGLIVDIVPNHMAATLENEWWRDVLAKGRASPFAASFDIDWQTDSKVFLPWLTKPLAEALAAGDLKIVMQPDGTRGLDISSNVLPLIGGGPLTVGLLGLQPYRLGWWRTAGDRINWRRFFDINDLVCLRMEDDTTFDRVHALPHRLYAEGLIDGVRVDHIDGLADPADYCRKLRQHLDPNEPSRPYLVVEKILLRGEVLPQHWGCDGTTGYDFMDQVSALQHNADGEALLKNAWAALSGRARDFAPEEETARREIIARSFGAQLEACAAAFEKAAESPELARPAVRRVLERVLTHFPVYRTYGEEGDSQYLDQAIEGARREALPNELPVFAVLKQSLAPIRRFQQLSAPIAAKAVEDTAFYRYGPLLSRNDVGFNIERFSLSADDFHELMQRRPMNGLLATATHDHKRGEDVRARLAVLSERAADWIERLNGWLAATASWRPDEVPVDADVAMLLQIVVGAWPLDLQIEDTTGRKAFAQRVAEWQQKALREAKLRSDWADPNEAYEAAARTFAIRSLTDDAFAREIHAFVQEVAQAGAIKGMAQALLKLTVPGVPDLYQGCEYWDFSLVDPDNRRPVDFTARTRTLGAGTPSWRSDGAKQAVIARTLALRRALPNLFAKGDYRPLRIEGAHAASLVAFARSYQGASVVVVVPRLTVEAGLRDATVLLPQPLALFDVLQGGCPLGTVDRLAPAVIGGDIPIGLFATQAGSKPS